MAYWTWVTCRDRRRKLAPACIAEGVCLPAWASILCAHRLPQEFQPWIKWLVFDAVLTLLLGLVVKRFESLRPVFEAIGWL
jgi:hypothetical protein